MSDEYDVIAVGGGHNGLVAAGYLARAGLRVIVLEKRHLAGGASVTEEVFPGFWANTGANNAAWIHPKILADMDLIRFGLEIIRPNPSVFTPFPDGRYFLTWLQKERVNEEIRKFAAADIEPYWGVRQYVKRFAEMLGISFLEPPPPNLGELTARIQTSEAESAFNRLMFGSVQELLDDWFESEEIKSLFAIISTCNNFASPMDPGSSYMLLHRSLSLDFIDYTIAPEWRTYRPTYRTRGGIGQLMTAMTDSIEASGAAVRTNAEVSHISVKNGQATGVVLSTGEEILGRVVVSNLDPHRTFLRLIDQTDLDREFREEVERLSTEGSCAKVIVAVDLLPRWRSVKDASLDDPVAQASFRISPSMAYMDKACSEAKNGYASTEPILWGSIPSVDSDAMTPPGKHIICLTTFHAPYHLKEENWVTEGDAYARRCIDVIDEYAAGFKESVIDYKCLSPVDLEDMFGMTGGHSTHVDMMPGHIFSSRPIPGWAGYKTPIQNLYMCGSGTFPGGQVSGLPGHNAAHVILEDLRATPGER
ncbi:MAG TPA: NAD(P)/FAD-dependent oxidoreductase [Dehalococcoidia bacterium]|nr:NAD(P)/FAD-dependent oxidoreductase [Dehalococcoidia bacterium]